ncbi:PHP domain-containing protein [Candidatus Gracilibacteria bacterium]|nr:PHP domain-containing protein [Candidatus Gracilibacteria bacterium]
MVRSYSHHSLLSAVPKIPALVDDAIAKGYTTIALTDEGTSSSFVEFYDYCQDKEIKPALGFTIDTPNLFEQNQIIKNQKLSKIALIAKNKNGYHNLLELISIARVVQEKPVPHLTLENIKKYLAKTSDLFVLICTSEHELGQFIYSSDYDKASKILQKYSLELNSQNVLVELMVSKNNYNQKKLKRGIKN